MLLEYEGIARIPRRKRHATGIQVKDIRKAVSASTGETRAIDRVEELKADTNPEYAEVDVLTTQLR